jgi:hypothetical protein
VTDRQKQKLLHGRLRELSEADRGYRAAFRDLTSAGGLEPSSFAPLLAAVDRLYDVLHGLDQERRREK